MILLFNILKIKIMKRVHLFFLIFGLVYTIVMVVIISTLQDMSWKSSHVYYVGFIMGLMITYNAFRSLNRLKGIGNMTFHK